MFTIQRAIHTIKGDYSKGILFIRIMPLFRLRRFILYQAPHSRALVPACGALVPHLKLLSANSFNLRNSKICPLTRIDPFLHDKILDQTKLKAFADDKLNVTTIIIIFSVFDRVENIVEEGEIACTSNFSFSHNVFKRLINFLDASKGVIVWERVKCSYN